MGAPYTPSQTVGPFFGFAMPFPDGHLLCGPGEPGALRLEGQVLDGAGEPVPDALLEVWHPAPGGGRFGRCRTDPEGLYRFLVVKPARQPAPGGGEQAPHLNVTVFARGLLRHLATRIYFPDEEAANAADPVLSLPQVAPARSSLVARLEGGVLRFDIRLQGGGETVFLAV